MASRQREWQLRQQALGNCIICGKPRGNNDNTYCPAHRASRVVARRLQRRSLKNHTNV